MNDFWIIIDDGEPDQRVFKDEDSAYEYRARTLQDEVVHVQRYQPALEVIDGVMSDKSQDVDWLRARYWEHVQRIEQLEELAHRRPITTNRRILPSR